jgi:kynurenine formamidase
VFNLVKLIDLTQEIYQGMPVYPGHVKTVLWYNDTHEETQSRFPKEYMFHSYASMGMLLSDHGPTHVDSVFHVTPEGKTIDNLPLEMFYTEAVCLDFSHVPPDEFITLKDVKDALKKDNLTIKKGDTVLMYTGHYNRSYGTGDWLYKYTGLDMDAAKWLGDQGVLNIGADAPSIDSSKAMDTRYYPGHIVCAEKHILNTENLANLEKVAGKRFIFSGLPLKIRGGTGSPIRAVAIINE